MLINYIPCNPTGNSVRATSNVYPPHHLQHQNRTLSQTAKRARAPCTQPSTQGENNLCRDYIESSAIDSERQTIDCEANQSSEGTLNGRKRIPHRQPKNGPDRQSANRRGQASTLSGLESQETFCAIRNRKQFTGLLDDKECAVENAPAPDKPQARPSPFGKRANQVVKRASVCAIESRH